MRNEKLGHGVSSGVGVTDKYLPRPRSTPTSRNTATGDVIIVCGLQIPNTWFSWTKSQSWAKPKPKQKGGNGVRAWQTKMWQNFYFVLFYSINSRNVFDISTWTKDCLLLACQVKTMSLNICIFWGMFTYLSMAWQTKWRPLRWILINHS